MSEIKKLFSGIQNDEIFDVWQKGDKINKDYYIKIILLIITTIILRFLPIFFTKCLGYEIKPIIVKLLIYSYRLLYFATMSLITRIFYEYNKAKWLEKFRKIFYLFFIAFFVTTILWSIPIIIICKVILEIFSRVIEKDKEGQIFSRVTEKNILALVNGSAVIITLYSSIIELISCVLKFFKGASIFNYIEYKFLTYDTLFIGFVILFTIIDFLTTFIYTKIIIPIELKLLYPNTDVYKIKYYEEYLFNVLGRFKVIALLVIFFLMSAKMLPDFYEFESQIINAITFATLVILVKDKNKEFKNKLEKDTSDTKIDN
ncbi:hypothetical protein [Peptoanaerobacter stomatis]